MTYLLIGIIILVFYLSVREEATQPIWGKIAQAYPTPRKGVKGEVRSFESILFWNIQGDKGWYNGMFISFTERGLSLTPPFFKPYIRAITIPWHSLVLDEDIIWYFQNKLVVKIPELNIYLALNRKHKQIVKGFILKSTTPTTSKKQG